MQKSLLYAAIGTAVSFLLNYFFGSQGWQLDLYYAVAFGIAWGLAYFLDSERFSLLQKMGISFLAMGTLVLFGVFCFSLKLALPSAMKFSVVFVAYYLIASFRESKSLRR